MVPHRAGQVDRSRNDAAPLFASSHGRCRAKRAQAQPDRRSGKDYDPERAGFTGLIAPAGLDKQWHRGLEDAWIVFNTFAITTAIGETFKNMVARERPAFYYEAESVSEFASPLLLHGPRDPETGANPTAGSVSPLAQGNGVSIAMQI